MILNLKINTIVKTTISPELANLVTFLRAFKDSKPIHLLEQGPVKSILGAESDLNSAQDAIRAAISQKQSTTSLCSARNAARSKFIETGTTFYEWMNSDVDLDQLETQYRASSLALLEAEVALTRTNNFDFVGAAISAQNALIDQERVISEVQKLFDLPLLIPLG